ncbi:hypothetical protein CJ030_MR2G022323 [Morella rubra]|uniref:CRM domain-containing protein n=1 Tax=Morella rubra TaxID=262757 RepID=A0A6A1WCQ6_9ROSI|nr:hypothetical protein CJ030_MR2G022323 [Morella rubra]
MLGPILRALPGKYLSLCPLYCRRTGLVTRLIRELVFDRRNSRFLKRDAIWQQGTIAEKEAIVLDGNEWERGERAPTLAELSLNEEDLRRLRTIGIETRKKLKIGKAGITEGIVNSIHERWRQSGCQDRLRGSL